jgi:hypothetical protein
LSQARRQRSGDSADFDLQTLLYPASAQEFLDRDYGRSFRHVVGTPGKFASLLPWTALNEILEQHRLEPPRLRLTREGKPVPPDRYLAYQANRRRSGAQIPRLNAPALTSELREGATLVLDNVDELHRPVRGMAEALERIFRVRVQVNCYSGWRTSHGFDVHWDDHDVFIVQVAGRKNWNVYGMTRPWPLGRDSVSAGDPPSEALWEGLLGDGDLLYIPRGWWHVATPLDEPTLHLTVGVNNPTGIDFLSWFVDRLRDAAVARQDLPHLQGTGAMCAHAGLLRDAILDTWRPELLEEYMAHLDATAKARPSFGLPWSATPDAIPEGAYRIRWAGRTGISIEAAGDEIAVAALGRRWRFRRQARPVLELLMSGTEYSREEMESIQGDMLSPEVIRAFVRELAVNGLVVIR